MFRTIAFNIVKYRFNDISFCSLRTVTEIGKILDFTAKCCWITCRGKKISKRRSRNNARGVQQEQSGVKRKEDRRFNIVCLQ